jgi:DNA-binding GntR family transcriptional regulator
MSGAVARRPSRGGVGAARPRDSGKPRATDVAYERLSQAIISLELEPGTLVNERELCNSLDVTRLTLSSALHRLAETGLISILPRRGVIIAPVDVLDAQQVYAARGAIEGKIAELAASRSSQAEVAALKALANKLEGVSRQSHDFRAWLDNDWQLHMALAKMARNRFLLDALVSVLKVNLRLWHLFFKQRGGEENSFLPHDQIIAAIEARNVDAAREAMAAHLDASERLLQSGLWGMGVGLSAVERAVNLPAGNPAS